MINLKQFRELIIRPSLEAIDLYSPGAEELLVGICAQESLGGYYINQIKGPADGIYEMEPATHKDIWENFLLKSKIELAQKILKTCNFSEVPTSSEMITNLKYATIMTRVFFLRFPDPIPASNDIDGIFDLYKRRYNTPLGSATKESFISNYFCYLKGGPKWA